MENNKKHKKIILVTLILFMFFSLLIPKKVDAFAPFGVTITLKDVERKADAFKKKLGKFGEIAFQALRKRMLIQIQNDLVNWAQGNGDPRFITNPGKFIKENATFAAVSTIDKFFRQHGTDICSPFKANVQFLVNKTQFLREEQLRCSWTDVKENMEKFANNFEDGGWTSWLKLHETRNTLPGVYLASTQLIGQEVALAGNTAQAKLSAGKGFLDQKKCAVYTIRAEYTISGDAIDSEGNLISPDSPQFQGFTGVGISDPVKPLKPIDMDKLPPNATCIQEETVTPGSVVGDFVTQGLLKGSLDSIVNATELSQIVNAVLDAYINKVARDGLSNVKTGNGSWTSASKANGGTYSSLDTIKTSQLGFESPEVISLLNRLIGFQNTAGQLINQINSLVRSEEQAENFKEKLKNDITAIKLSTVGVNLGGETDETDDVIDRLYHRKNYNDEPKNPGPYVANQVFYNVIGGLWEQIETKLEDIENKSCSIASIPDIRIYASPKKEALPFTDGNGKVFIWLPETLTSPTGARAPFTYLTYDGTFTQNVEDVEPTKMTSFDAWKSSYLTTNGLIVAGSAKSINKTTAQAYAESISNSKKIAETFQEDLKEVSEVVDGTSRLTSLLTDYDKALRETNTIKAMQDYLSALESSDENQLKTKRSVLLEKQLEARNKWRLDQETILKDSNISITEKDKVAAKIRIIEIAIDAIESSLRGLASLAPDLTSNYISLNTENFSELSKDEVIELEENTRIYIRSRIPTPELIKIIAVLDSVDFIKNGESVSDAVANALSINIPQIEKMLEEKESRASSYSTDVTNTVGNFLTKEDENEVGNIAEKRKELGVTGGESEWEKYYKNRFQLAYAVLIDDYFTNKFPCK
ncbi:MAG: hypothetical protein Q8Q95_03795 [bacterium]|nr:hypothetical protein [bacterium]